MSGLKKPPAQNNGSAGNVKVIWFSAPASQSHRDPLRELWNVHNAPINQQNRASRRHGPLKRAPAGYSCKRYRTTGQAKPACFQQLAW